MLDLLVAGIALWIGLPIRTMQPALVVHPARRGLNRRKAEGLRLTPCR